MLSVSNGFVTAMSATSRRCYAKIFFRQIDIDAAGDSTATASGQAEISDLTQLVDEIVKMTSNYATFENDRWLLDGSFVLPPDVSYSGQVGWWSDSLSQSDKTFVAGAYPTLTFTFTQPHSSIGFTITFDRNNNEYAEEFAIIAYDANNDLIDAYNFTGNTDVQCILKNNPIANYSKIEIVIKKWSKAYRRARIIDILFGVIQTFTNVEITKMSVLEELSPTSSKVTSNELNFSIDNSDKKYDLINPSGIYAYMQKQMEIKAYIGTDVGSDIEYAQVGVFYLTDWGSNYDGLVASFKGRDSFEFLQNRYRKGLYQSRTLYNLAVDVLTDAGYTSSDYSIDTALQSITVLSYIPLVKHKDALQSIAVAGQCALWSDREGLIQMKQLSTTTTGYTLDFDNAYKYPEITLEKILKTVEVEIHTFTSATGASEVFKGVITVSGTQDVWIEYKKPCVNAEASIIGGTLNSATYYTGTALLNITASGTVTIYVTGNELTDSKTIHPVNTAEEEGITLKVTSQLITTSALAENVGQWVKTEESKRYKYRSNWRQNPMLEAGDIIGFENQFDVAQEGRIIKQTIDYNGALGGETEGRG